MENTELSMEKFEELANQLAESFLSTVEILKRIVLMTEKFYDGSHSRFLAEKAEKIGSELGLKDESLTELVIAAQLHDLGKVGFSDTLLFKNSTEMELNEFKIYSKHPEIAYNILSVNPHFSEIAKIILFHHEKLDGTGFPYHLTGEKIHYGSKIISVLDIYHNAIFKRKTIKQRTNQTIQNINTQTFLENTKDRFNNIMNFLYARRGTQFETKVVEALIEIETNERRALGEKTITRRAVNQLEPGMKIADDYYTSFGMLIAARGETLTHDSIRALIRFVENGELPVKILVMD